MCNIIGVFCGEGYCGPDQRCVAHAADGQPCDPGVCGPQSTCREKVCTPLPDCP